MFGGLSLSVGNEIAFPCRHQWLTLAEIHKPNHTERITMQKRPFLVPILGLAALSLATALVFAQPKPADPASTPSAIEKAVLETNDKMTRAADSLNAEAFFDYIVNTDKSPVIQNGILFKTRQEALQAVKRGFAGLSKVTAGSTTRRSRSSHPMPRC